MRETDATNRRTFLKGAGGMLVATSIDFGVSSRSGSGTQDNLPFYPVQNHSIMCHLGALFCPIGIRSEWTMA